MLQSIGAESSSSKVECESFSNEFEIRNFYIQDFSRNLFYMEVKAMDRTKLPEMIVFKEEGDKTEFDKHKEKESEKATSIQKLKFIIKMNGKEADRVNGSYNYHKNSSVIDFELISADSTPSGDTCIQLYDSNLNLLASKNYELPERFKEGGKQPLILEISPNGGVIGDTITIKGKNFQDDLDNIYVYIIDEHQDPNYIYGDKPKYSIFPYFLSKPDDKGIQEIKFTIPAYDLKSEYDTYKFYEKIFGKSFSIKLMSNFRPSTIETIVILKPYWKYFAGAISIAVTVAFILSIALILRKVNFIHEILIDSNTNSYSLSNFQSFAWTIVFLGSYFYVAICAGIILNKSELPDFNFSLIGLMGISYGGLITSTYLEKRNKKQVFYKDKPELKDLIADPNGGIDLSKLQLLGFTLISIIVYVFYLFKSNVLQGLPGIPETLHTMLLTSQGGYLGSKALEKKETTEPEPAKEEPIAEEVEAEVEEPEPAKTTKAPSKKKA